MTAPGSASLPRRARLAWLFAAAAAATLAGCGGGSSSDSSGGSPVPPPSPSTTLTLSLAGGRSGGYSHVWVTVTAVALGTDATKAYTAGDSTWTTITLGTPVTVDLASASATSGQLTDLLKAAGVPPGTYPQIRLLPADPDASLVAPATADGLRWNDQVDYVDGGGTSRSVPLEFAGLDQGLALQVPLTIADGGAAYIAVEWDAASSLVRRASTDGVDRFVVRNDLRAYDRTRSGAVMGIIDPSNFCAGAPAPACISDLTVEADATPSGGSAGTRARAAQVALSGDSRGAFFLYPLPDVGTVDLVVRGRHMQTMVVRGVSVQPVGSLVTVPTVVGSASAPLLPVVQATEHALTLAQPTSPMASQGAFFQTPAAGAVPLEIAAATADPATGLWTTPVLLPGGPLQVASYDAANPGAALSFATVSPAEGDGGYLAQLRGPSTALPSALGAVAPGDATWTAPALSTVGGLTTGTLSVHVTANAAFDHAELLIANDSGVVAVKDVSAFMGFLGGTATFSLPAGDDAADPLGTLYTATVRAWNSSDEAGTLTHVQAPGVADLRSAGSASLAVPEPR